LIQHREQRHKIYQYLAGQKLWGHSPAPIYKESVYTHVGDNVNGVEPFRSQDSLITLVSNLTGLQAGGCSRIETNTEWKRYEYQQNADTLLIKMFGAVRAEYITFTV
jgi:hypothetical protein